MLVLSRRPDQSIEMPALGISVKILGFRSNSVKVGIEAPEDIRVFRGEIEVDDSFKSRKQNHTVELTREEFHELRNDLNTIGLAAQLMDKQIKAHLYDDARASLQQLIAQFGRLTANLKQRQTRESAGPECRALLVEDDDNERELLAGLLRMHGHNVVTVKDGAEALDYLKDQQGACDVVLLDMRMPRCDGPTTIRAIREDPALAKLPVFAVSATAPSEFGVPTGNRGVNHWFSKPLNPEQLTRELGLLAN